MSKHKRKSTAAQKTDAAIETLIGRLREQHESAAIRFRSNEETLARFQRAHLAWLRVAQFRGDSIPSRLTGDSLDQAYAEIIVKLGKQLKEDGWQEQVAAVKCDSDPKRYALAMLARAMDGEIATVMRMVTAAKDNLFAGIKADSWLRDGLRHEVLKLKPAPKPPAGWEGNYFEAVETVHGFVNWIDQRFMIENMINRNGEQPTDGRRVRNAFRLISKLNLPGMPEEPTEQMTVNCEMAILRNLKRTCVEQRSSGKLKNRLANELGNTITRLQQNPRILFEREPAHHESLNTEELNWLADRAVFVEKRDGNEVQIEQRQIVLNHPNNNNAVCWCIWHRTTGNEGLNQAKLDTMLDYLRAWQDWAIGKRQPVDESGSRGRPGRRTKSLSKADQRILERWDTKHFRNYYELRDALKTDDGIVVTHDHIEKLMNRRQAKESRQRKKGSC